MNLRSIVKPRIRASRVSTMGLCVVALALIASACAQGPSSTTTAAPTTAPPATTSTTAAPPTTAPPATATTPPTTGPLGLDLADQPWVLHTIEGITDSSGELLFDTDPVLGEANLVRDRAGGIVFEDVFGLWWWRAGETDPELVLQDTGLRLIEVIPTAGGPVVRLGGVTDRYVGLESLTEVAPVPGSVEIAEDFSETRSAANGLTATVTQPEVTLDFEGFPDEVIEPAHLVVSRDGQVVLDLRIGGPVEAYARLHDFDGRYAIVSRGPFEPALPPETYLVIDLECADCTKTFISAATTAALTGPDADWNGSVVAPEGPCSSWDPEFAGSADVGLPDAAADARADLLRAAAACDITGLSYEMAPDADLVLSHAALERFDPSTWLAVAPDLLGDLSQALSLPGREVVDGEEASFVFPAWFAVDGWDQLTGSEQTAMTEWYGAEASSFWDDYFAIARPEDLSITISGAGIVTAVRRPLS